MLWYRFLVLYLGENAVSGTGHYVLMEIWTVRTHISSVEKLIVVLMLIQVGYRLAAITASF